MYSHYQQYQQVPTAVTAQPSVSSVNSGTYSTYASAVQQGAAASSSAVATYTQYYHSWKKQADDQRRLAQSLPEGSPAKAEALRQAQWADYYADQSTRAAHFAYNNPNSTTAAPPAPPAPPQQQQQQQPVASPTKQTSRWDVAAAPTAAAPAAATNQNATAVAQSPGGLKRYVHKCLAQCSTEEQRQLVQRDVEKLIAKAIQNGNMHTTNWDAMELVSLGASPKHQDARPLKKPRVEKTNARDYYDSKLPVNNSYYGSSSSKRDNYEAKLPMNNSYYGASSKKESPSSKRNGYDATYRYDSYYGNSSIDTSSRASKENHKNESFYGPSSSDLGGEDFVSLPTIVSRSKKNKTLKKQKSLDSQDSGFERSSSALKKRANRFSGRGGISHAASVPETADSMERYMGKALIGGTTKKLDETDYEHMTVKGTCPTLEKAYLRLTAPPRAELVRPPSVLEQHLHYLKNEWSNSPKDKRRDYTWFCSQLKAVRQDLTVQRINNGLAVEAYETHARIALVESDLNEYNQCQTQLKELYETLQEKEDALKNGNEFIAYRIIYYVLLTGNKKYEGGSSDLFKIMLALTPEQREDPCIDHALKVRVAVADYDYHAFFRLQDTCPNLGAYLMDFMVPNVRHWALQRICKAFRPSVPINYVLRELGFDPNDSDQMEEGKKWLVSCGCVLTDDTLQTKDSVVRESTLAAKTSLI